MLGPVVVLLVVVADAAIRLIVEAVDAADWLLPLIAVGHATRQAVEQVRATIKLLSNHETNHKSYIVILVTSANWHSKSFISHSTHDY